MAGEAWLGEADPPEFVQASVRQDECPGQWDSSTMSHHTGERSQSGAGWRHTVGVPSLVNKDHGREEARATTWDRTNRDPCFQDVSKTECLGTELGGLVGTLLESVSRMDVAVHPWWMKRSPMYGPTSPVTRKMVERSTPD